MSPCGDGAVSFAFNPLQETTKMKKLDWLFIFVFGMGLSLLIYKRVPIRQPDPPKSLPIVVLLKTPVSSNTFPPVSMKGEICFGFMSARAIVDRPTGIVWLQVACTNEKEKK